MTKKEMRSLMSGLRPLDLPILVMGAGASCCGGSAVTPETRRVLRVLRALPDRERRAAVEIARALMGAPTHSVP